MSTDKSEREAFETEIRKDCGDLSTFGSGKDLHYRNSAVNNAWIGWKARASQPATVVPVAEVPLLALHLIEDAAQAHDQCRAVVHMALSLAEVYVARAAILAHSPDAPIALIGESSAATMEYLGDLLSNMDAVEEGDEWLDPIFEAAQARWPVSHPSAPAESGWEPIAAAPLLARALVEWHEDDGPVAWWAWCGHEFAGEPAWCGTPNDSDWPGYHTHWTAHPPLPAAPSAAQPGGEDSGDAS